MNYIAASLLYHSDEVIAFSLLVHLLNDYHLKEVHMSDLHGFYEHSQIIEYLLADMLPEIATQFKQHQVQMVTFSSKWIICLFSQSIPL